MFMKRTFDAFFKNNITKLGRWEHRNNPRTNEIKLLLANHDHCGDNICGTPKPINMLLSETKVNPYSGSFTSRCLFKHTESICRNRINN